MGAGLIHLATGSCSDLYLIGAPQITFFKMCYRRYTNFAFESFYLDFDSSNFNYESECKVPKIADLIHKGYLHISIPSINITKNDVGIDESEFELPELNNFPINAYENVSKIYTKILTDIYRIVFKATKAVNVTGTELIKNVNDYALSNQSSVTRLEEYNQLLNEEREVIGAKNEYYRILDPYKSNILNIIEQIEINKLFQNAENTIELSPNDNDYNTEIQNIVKKDILFEVENGIDVLKSVNKYFFNKKINHLRIQSEQKNNNIKCAWTKKLGHSIIDYIDLYIGGKKIDHHIGQWIDIWHQLTSNYSQENIYNEMIGNVKIMTNFDNIEKPSYNIYIPLSFWFNNYNGLSYPLIASQYNDVSFRIKTKKIEEVFYIEKLYQAEYQGSTVIVTADLINRISTLDKIVEIDVNEINIADIFEKKKKNILFHIILDYVYLESRERKRFATSGHEYLITRIQTEISEMTTSGNNNSSQERFSIPLDFTNPSKELIWFFQKKSNQLFHTNYSADLLTNYYDDESKQKINPIKTCGISFNSYTRVRTQDGKYFGVYQPLNHHKTSIDTGINMYSFAIKSKESQPNGSCNFSRLTDAKLSGTISDQLYRYTDNQIYPFDSNIDFLLTVNKAQLLEKIDDIYAQQIIKLWESGKMTINQNDAKKLYELAEKTHDIYQLLEGSDDNEQKIMMSDYRYLIFKTDALCTVFSHSINILRMIGGYADLAFSGKK
jgi:hypothetical protein